MKISLFAKYQKSIWSIFSFCSLLRILGLFIFSIVWGHTLRSFVLCETNTSAHIFFVFLQALREPSRCGGGYVLEYTRLSLSLAKRGGGGLQ